MKTLSHDSIPFFGHINPPFIIYIIENKILGFDPLNLTSYDFAKAFLLLTELMQSEQALAVFPSVFQQFFNGKNYSLDKKQFKLFGYVEHVGEYIGCYRCFDLDFVLDFTKDKPVIFQDMFFEEFPLKKEIELSLEEAAIILANISSIPYLLLFGPKLIPLNTKEELDKQFSLPYEEGKKISFIVNKTPFNMTCNKFVIYYFKYLQKLLLEKQITPKQLLNYNGLIPLALLMELPPVFSFLEEVMDTLLNPSAVPKQQLILYYAFFNCAYSNMRYMTDIQKATILLEYYQKNNQMLKREFEKLYVHLPISQEYWELLIRLS